MNTQVITGSQTCQGDGSQQSFIIPIPEQADPLYWAGVTLETPDGVDTFGGVNMYSVGRATTGLSVNFVNPPASSQFLLNWIVISQRS
jgi:hypothetical protein